MNDMENLRTFADQLWKYMVPKLKSMFASNVSYFRAQVVSNPGNNTLEVERPLETGTLTLPCTAAMSGAAEGQQVTVLVMGSLSNAVVVGDGKMNGELGALPIERGGTGETTALAALTALGGLSAKDFGVSLYSNANINTLLTPGTYRCSTGAIAATITGTPTTGSGFRLFVMVGHNANTFVHIADIGSRLLIRSTADQGITWTDWEGFSMEGHTHDYLPLTGGTLTGNLAVQRDSGTSSLILDTPEKTDVGRARTQLQKNASASSDNGTNLIDYVWGNGSTATQRVNLRLQASATQLRDRLRLVDYAAGGSGTTYRLYGEHNAPAIANVTGLEARLTAIEDRLTALENG